MKQMKKIIVGVLCCIIPLQVSAGCSTATTTRMWDVLSTTDILLLSVNSNLNQLQSDVAVNFAATFTTIGTIGQHYSSAMSSANTVISNVSTTNSAIAVTQSIINTINPTITALNQDISVMQTNDFIGTFSVIKSINNTATSQFATLASSLNAINLMLNVISGSQLENFLATSGSIASISSVVLTNLQEISEISTQAASDFDIIESSLDIVLATNATLSSKISRSNTVVQQDFAGTWTALATVATIVTAIDTTASILDTLLISADVSLINTQLQTINSAIDFTTRQLNTSNATLSTISSFINPIATHLDTINSRIDVLLRIQAATVSSDTSSLVAHVATINSLCDVTIGLESVIGSQVSRLDVDALILTSNYTTLNSKLDITNLNVSIVGSLSNALNSSLVSDLTTIISAQTTIESDIGVLFTVSSTLDQFGTLQSRVGVLNSDITQDLQIARTISSKTNVLYAQELSALGSLNTIFSRVSTLDTQINTITSSIGILASSADQLTSTISNTTLPITNTVSSKAIFIESSVASLDSTIHTIQASVNTISSNLTLLHTDFQQTWTIINALQKIANSSNSLLITTQSALNALTPIVVDMGGTFTALAVAQQSALSIQSVLASINTRMPDTAGTYTALTAMTSLSSDIFTTLINTSTSFPCIGTVITPSDIGTTGYTINSAGNYVLAASVSFLAVTDANVITINASNVTLDLGGNTITRGNATLNVRGILVNSSISNVTIKNGIISGMSAASISTSSGVSKLLLENLVVSSSSNNGIDLVSNTNDVIIRDVMSNLNNFSGLVINTGSNILIVNSQFCLNSQSGINLTPFPQSFNPSLSRLTIFQCAIYDNGNHGINIFGIGIPGPVLGGPNIVIDTCSIMANTGSGIRARSVIASTFKNNVFASNDYGITLEGSVADVEVSNNIFMGNGSVGLAFILDMYSKPCAVLNNIFNLNTFNFTQETWTPHSVLGNCALNTAEDQNYQPGLTTINVATVGATVGTFSVRPGRWRNISASTT